MFFSWTAFRIVFLVLRYISSMEISVGSQREEGGKEKRKKKESRFAKRSNDRPVQQLGDHLRESDLNTGCRLLNSRTASIHSRPRVCRAEGASRSPSFLDRSKTKRSPGALEINTKYTLRGVARRRYPRGPVSAGRVPVSRAMNKWERCTVAILGSHRPRSKINISTRSAR